MYYETMTLANAFDFISEAHLWGSRPHEALVGEREEGRALMAEMREATHHHLIDEPLVALLLFERPLAKFHELVLRSCVKLGVRFASIGRRDFICFGGIQVEGWPAAWAISRSIGMDHSCGNGPQSQIHGLFGFAPNLMGVFDTSTGERLCDAIGLMGMNNAKINEAIPDGQRPDLSWWIRHDYA